MYSVGCITIPASVKSINEDAFGWRKSIQCVTFQTLSLLLEQKLSIMHLTSGTMGAELTFFTSPCGVWVNLLHKGP